MMSRLERLPFIQKFMLLFCCWATAFTAFDSRQPAWVPFVIGTEALLAAVIYLARAKS